MDEQHNERGRRGVRLGRGLVAAGVIGAVPLLAVPAFAASSSSSISNNGDVAVARQIEAGRASDTVHIGARAILGVEVSDQSSRFGDATSGVTIAGVEPGGPADTAGLAAGDTLPAITGHTVVTTDDVAAGLDAQPPGASVRVPRIDAGGASHSATVTLEAGPPA